VNKLKIETSISLRTRDEEVEITVGSYLINNQPENTSLYYWRESTSEVDFVLSYDEKLLAIETKRGRGMTMPPPRACRSLPKSIKMSPQWLWEPMALPFPTSCCNRLKAG